jgi:UDP-galactopyranose mutase
VEVLSYDFIIIGAGIAGITMAEQAANILGKKVLLIDKRNHIGGNCYDYYNDDGILVHKYGPHIFHTNNTKVYNYLSLYTTWISYNHKVLGKIGGNLVPIPFNLISIDKCLPDISNNVKTAILDEYEVNQKVPILEMKKSDNPIIAKLAHFVYEKVFLHYTEKMWGLTPEELDASVTSRVPIQISYDCRYFQDVYQGIPRDGYTNMFNNMLSNHNINILLEKDYHDIISIDYEQKKIYLYDEEFTGEVIFTGMIDEFFNYEYGPLPYRAMVFMDETSNQEHFQENATINYPNDYHFTRITEYKYLTGQVSDKTTIQLEFPEEYDYTDKNAIACYPIPQEKNEKLYMKYKLLADEFEQVTFIGRLAEYKYMNMDVVVEKVLNLISEKFTGV